MRRLCNELVSVRPERRRASLYALAHLVSFEAAEEVRRLAADPDPNVRLALLHTAEALLPDPEPLIGDLTTDADPEVRDVAELQLLRGFRKDDCE